MLFNYFLLICVMANFHSCRSSAELNLLCLFANEQFWANFGSKYYFSRTSGKNLDFFRIFDCHLELWQKWKILFISKTKRDTVIFGKFGSHRATLLGALKN